MAFTPLTKSLFRISNGLLQNSILCRTQQPSAAFAVVKKLKKVDIRTPHRPRRWNVDTVNNDFMTRDGRPIYPKPKMKLQLQGIDLTKYTYKAFPYPKTGGRGQDGKIFNKRIGGGSPQKFRMVDFRRITQKPGETMKERVVYIRHCPLRTGHIALVASGNKKRWILASENMKVGDLIESSDEIPEVPVRPDEGNAYPVGALPYGTVIHNIERYPTEGGRYCRAAGSSATYVNKVGNQCIIRLPSKQEISVDQECSVVVGKVSNVSYKDTPIGSPNRARWLGIRPKSGLRQKKNGYHGRKMKKTRPTITFEAKTKPLHKMFDV